MGRSKELQEEATIVEKRQFPRLDVDLPVVLRHNGHLIPATALNISCGGMCLKTDNPEIVDNGNVEVIFDLATGEKDVSVRGKIVRLERDEETEMGIQFVNLYSAGHQALERFIRKHLH